MYTLKQDQRTKKYIHGNAHLQQSCPNLLLIESRCKVPCAHFGPVRIYQSFPEMQLKKICYLRPSSRVPHNPIAPWFQSVPIGRNQLGKMVPNMYVSAGIAGHKTNHSLRASAVTDLFQANVLEKLIQERTGHKTVQALRVYQHTTDDQQKAVSEVLSYTTKQSFLQMKDTHNYQPHLQSLC